MAVAGCALSGTQIRPSSYNLQALDAWSTLSSPSKREVAGTAQGQQQRLKKKVHETKTVQQQPRGCKMGYKKAMAGIFLSSAFGAPF